MTDTIPEKIHVDDPEAKKFYEKRNQDAMLLQPGDLIVRGGKLRMVKEVKKNSRGSGGAKVTLDNGFTFDSSGDVFSRKDKEPSDLRNITFWRPRPGF